MEEKVPLWANNTSKIESRELIVAQINKYLIGDKITMFELLGQGVGAKYYCEQLDINKIALIEKDVNLFNEFDIKSLNGKGIKFNLDVYKFFSYYTKGEQVEIFNVINLDFCAWFYDNEKPNSTAQIIDKMFESGTLCDQGLLFCTFQIDGWNLDKNKVGYKEKYGRDIPCTPEQIFQNIQYHAMRNHYKVSEPILSNEYKAGSRRGSKMLNLGFQVTKLKK